MIKWIKAAKKLKPAPSNGRALWRICAGLWLGSSLWLAGLSAATGATEVELGEPPCANHLTSRQAFFGDLHAHTRYSQDANWRMGTTQSTPDDAYAFAKGGEITLPPYDAEGRSARSTRIGRPLDFAMVADHAENMDLVRICDDQKFADHQSDTCGKQNQMMSLFLKRVSAVLPKMFARIGGPCASDSSQCRTAAADVWRDTQAAAEQHNAPCSFSTFIGYEWSGLLGMSNMHRNVVFRNAEVIDRPISAISAPHVEQLWTELEQQCTQSGSACDAITIAHNPNLSDGKMFSALQSNGEVLGKSEAVLRQRYEPLVEIIQHKGASECAASGLSNDEWCDFEVLNYANFAAKYLPFLAEPLAYDSRYMREALREGLRLRSSLGTNPFELGFVGSTDTHISAPGAVEEDRYMGNHGAQAFQGFESAQRPQLPDRLEQNPGGLAVLIAEQNTRDSLFDAMQRREAYATSGTRIRLRFFAANNDELSAELCDQPDMLSKAYAQGAPMGSTLTLSSMPEAKRAPQLLISAMQDPGTEQTPGADLQQIQIIKGWLDEQGHSKERVVTVAGQATTTEARLQAERALLASSCNVRKSGFKKLCASWQDPNFEESQQAYYYARVLEVPSCRWQTHICLANAVNCNDISGVAEGLRSCCDANTAKTIQERAWSSPIWISRTPTAAAP